MANPYFSNSQYFGRSQPQPGSVAQVGYQPDANSYAAPQPYGTPSTQPVDPQFQSVQDAYYGPSAGPAQTGRLSYDDVIMKTATVVGAIVLVAAAVWFGLQNGLQNGTIPASAVFGVVGVGLVGGLVLGLVNSFKREPSPVLILGYALFEGALLGAISMIFDARWPGVALQAVLATFVTFGVTLALFKSGKVRVTAKFTKVLMIGLISYAVFCVVNLVLAWTVLDGWGLRSGALGLVIGAVAVVLAAMTLIMDFDQIQRGVTNGVDRKYAWSAAFGIALSLVWLYLEFLRILAILRGD